MKILAVGGGSGGHVTPVVAVLSILKRRTPAAELRFWCDRTFEPQARKIIGGFDPSLKVETIVSGKLRRYHSLPLWRQLARPVSIVGPNLIDMVKVAVGFIQSFIKLVAWRPDVVFCKGGYVCLPVGFAAHLLRIPLVIHDSDAHPGLTNRILARWADGIATGAPLHNYHYPAKKSRYVGIPISTACVPYDTKARQAAKKAIGFDPNNPLLVITGGGLGAQRLNQAVVDALKELLEYTSIFLISGQGHYDELQSQVPSDNEHFKLAAFIAEGMPQVLGAADIVVARAGATTIQELAAMAKPTILVPNIYLTGGHQLKNAAAFAENGAVKILLEADMDKDPGLLMTTIRDLLAQPAMLERMGKGFFEYAKPRAAEDMADMVLSAAGKD